MRGLALFVAGLVVGGIAVSAAVAQNEHSSPNKGIVALNHICIVVPDIDKAVDYYTKVMGFPEAFRVKNAQGQIQLVYVQISQNTFIEIQPATPDKPAGLNHFGVQVENVKDAMAMYKARGANVIPGNPSATKAVLANVADPNGIRMEMTELPPESLHRQAMNRWKP